MADIKLSRKLWPRRKDLKVYKHGGLIDWLINAYTDLPRLKASRSLSPALTDPKMLQRWRGLEASPDTYSPQRRWNDLTIG